MNTIIQANSTTLFISSHMNAHLKIDHGMDLLGGSSEGPVPDGHIVLCYSEYSGSPLSKPRPDFTSRLSILRGLATVPQVSAGCNLRTACHRVSPRAALRLCVASGKTWLVPAPTLDQQAGHGLQPSSGMTVFLCLCYKREMALLPPRAFSLWCVYEGARQVGPCLFSLLVFPLFGSGFASFPLAPHKCTTVCGLEASRYRARVEGGGSSQGGGTEIPAPSMMINC